MPILNSTPTGRRLERLAITLVCLYLLSPFGATFNGVVIPDAHLATYGLIFAVLAAWFVGRVHRHWRWHRTVMDPVLPLWLIAIAASMLANPDALARSLIALWFVAAYIGAWHLLHDWIANRPDAIELLVDGVLGAGLMVVIFSAIQMAHSGNLLQPVSVIGNANALGSVLLVIVPLALRKTWRAQAGAQKAVWSLYSAIALANLVLTLSRGAWFGLIAALATLLLLLLTHHGLLSPSSLLAWWVKRNKRVRQLARGFSFVGIFCLVGMLALLVNSFTLTERSANRRTEIWRSALRQFSDAPLTGNGLFTFGRNSGQHISIPPAQSYAHAHNLPLNVAAEMGILGLLALSATIALIVRRLRRVWRAKAGVHRKDWIFFVAPIVGLAVHHLFDFTAMMPAVALLGIISLVLALDPTNSKPLLSARLSMFCAVGLMLLWMCLLTVGHRNSEINRRYIAALRLATSSDLEGPVSDNAQRYRQALDILDELIASDPTMPVYHHQSALLWGLLAAAGDHNAIDRGIQAFERFLALEPNHAISWANLSVLQWQSGDLGAEIHSMRLARKLAPRYLLFPTRHFQYRKDYRIMPVKLPHNRYNQDFTRYQFLRESLPVTFLPQISWSFQRP